MDDQGAGGSSRASDQNPHRRPLRESSLPPTLLPHLYHAPRHGSSPRIAPLIVPDWPNQSTRSRSQDHGRSLPSPSHLLRQTESTLDYDRVILSRSLDASPVNPAYVPNLNLPPPRIVLERSRPLVDHSAHSTRDRPMGGYPYPPVTRSTNTSPYEHQPRSYSHAPLYGHEPTSRTPQPLQPPPRRVGPSPGIRDVFMEEIGVLPQPEVPIRPLRDPHAELRHSPEFAQEQRRGRSEVRATHTSRTHRSQIQVQDYRVTYGQSHAEGSQRDLHRQMEPFPFQLIRERRPSIVYPTNPLEEHQRFQPPPPQQQRQPARYQPQPQQYARFSQLLSGPGYQGGIGASSSSQSGSSSRSQTIPNFPGEPHSDGQLGAKPLYQGSSMAEPSATGIQEATRGQKKAQRLPAVKKGPGTPAEEGGSAGTSTGAKTSTKRRATTKVAVACWFCRARKLKCDGKRPCSNCSGRGHECRYQVGGPRRRGPGKAPKKSGLRQQYRRAQQRAQQRGAFNQSQMPIGVGSPGPSRPPPAMTVPAAGIMGGGSPLMAGGRETAGPQLPSQSPGESTSEMETGSQTGSRRRSPGSSVEEPERKRSRIRELDGEKKP